VIQAKLLKIINVFLVYPKTRVAITSQLILVRDVPLQKRRWFVT
jgi:hypothetical protein